MTSIYWFLFLSILLFIQSNSQRICKANIYLNGYQSPLIQVSRDNGQNIIGTSGGYGQYSASLTINGINSDVVILLSSSTSFQDGQGALMATIDIIAEENGIIVDQHQLYTNNPLTLTNNVFKGSSLNTFNPCDPSDFIYWDFNSGPFMQNYASERLTQQSTQASWVYDSTITSQNTFKLEFKFSDQQQIDIMNALNCEEPVLDGECYDYLQCASRNINGKAECFGYTACITATIDTNDKVTCSGYQSCASGDTSITSSNDIICSAEYACYGWNDHVPITSTGGLVECGSYMSCRSAQITTNDLSCSGYYSCQMAYKGRATIEVSGTDVQCTASMSCANNIINANVASVECSGHQSCWNSDINAGFVSCRGESSCEQATVVAKDVFTDGYISLKSAYITAPKVVGTGYQSLSKANIQSTGRKLNVKLYGYNTGKDAIVLCNNGQRCTVICSGNACEDLTFKCQKRGKCTVKLTGCGINARGSNNPQPIDPNTGIICPNFIQQAVTSLKDINHKVGNDKLNNKVDDTENEIDDIISTDAVNQCDDSFSCTGQSITDGNVYGYNACVGCMITSSSYVYCRSDSSCKDASSISTTNNVLCTGPQSCFNVDSIKGSNIYCRSTASCGNVVIITGYNAYCEGKSSCKNSKFDITGIVDCLGTLSCRNSRINANELNCWGSFSCSEGEYSAFNVITCKSHKSCFKSIIRDTKKLALHGSYDASGSNIYGVGVIRAYGEKSLENAIISSDTGFDVFLYGYNSGYGAIITCETGTVCTLQCLANGCENTQFICQTGSSCSVIPTECKDDNSVSITADGTICPNWINYGQDFGCYAKVYANGDNSMKVSVSTDGGSIVKQIDSSNSFETTTNNRLDVVNNMLIQFEVTDDRSSKRNQYGGFVATIDIVNLNGDIFEIISNNPLTNFDTVPPVSDPITDLIYEREDVEFGSRHCQANHRCDRFPLLSAESYWVWDHNWGNRLIFQIDFNKYTQNLTDHGCISTSLNYGHGRYFFAAKHNDTIVGNGFRDIYLYFIVFGVAIVLMIICWKSRSGFEKNSVYSPLL